MSALLDAPLARRVARAGIGDGPAAMPGGADLDAAAARASEAVIAYTRLNPAEQLPEAEWVSRSEWIEMNLVSMTEMLAAVEERASGLTSGAVGAIARRVVAVEAGALLNFASRHVLGQYEFPLLGGERAPRLVFVGENLGNATGQLGGRPQEVLDWVALHEVTHAVHFASAPWMRGHIGGLARTLLTDSSVGISFGDLAARAKELGSDPRAAIAEIRSSDPVSLLAPAESVETINAVQAVMASVEGYAEHVMDAAESELGEMVAELRAAIERRRDNRNPVLRLLTWLLGFELKLRQYREGKRFCDEVVAEGGIDALNRAWSGPPSLPSLTELRDPGIWLERTSAAPLAA